MALSVERLNSMAAESYAAAMDERFSPELRAYYAAVALWADKKARKLAEK
jgi:hypothetical protein